MDAVMPVCCFVFDLKAILTAASQMLIGKPYWFTAHDVKTHIELKKVVH